MRTFVLFIGYIISNQVRKIVKQPSKRSLFYLYYLFIKKSPYLLGYAVGTEGMLLYLVFGPAKPSLVTVIILVGSSVHVCIEVGIGIC